MYAKNYLAALAVALACGWVLVTATAQMSVKVKSFRVEPDGRVVWHEGELISKQGVNVSFRSHMEAGKSAGYELASADVDKWKSGDKVPLYIRGIKRSYSAREYGRLNKAQRRAVEATKIFGAAGDAAGGWSEVTFDSIKRNNDHVAIAFDEEVQLENGEWVKQVDFTVVEGFLIPAPVRPSATAPTQKK